jgi:hypothetical protein
LTFSLSAALKEICVGYPNLFTSDLSARSMNFREIPGRQVVENLAAAKTIGEYASVTIV